MTYVHLKNKKIGVNYIKELIESHKEHTVMNYYPAQHGGWAKSPKI